MEETPHDVDHDLDLGSGHITYCRASVIDLYLHTKFHSPLYLHTKFHSNRRNFVDVPYVRTDIEVDSQKFT